MSDEFENEKPVEEMLDAPEEIPAELEARFEEAVKKDFEAVKTELVAEAEKEGWTDEDGKLSDSALLLNAALKINGKEDDRKNLAAKRK